MIILLLLNSNVNTLPSYEVRTQTSTSSEHTLSSCLHSYRKNTSRMREKDPSEDSYAIRRVGFFLLLSRVQHPLHTASCHKPLLSITDNSLSAQLLPSQATIIIHKPLSSITSLSHQPHTYHVCCIIRHDISSLHLRQQAVVYVNDPQLRVHRVYKHPPQEHCTKALETSRPHQEHQRSHGMAPRSH